jgi:hypothetical protein
MKSLLGTVSSAASVTRAPSTAMRWDGDVIAVIGTPASMRASTPISCDERMPGGTTGGASAPAAAPSPDLGEWRGPATIGKTSS